MKLFTLTHKKTGETIKAFYVNRTAQITRWMELDIDRFINTNSGVICTTITWNVTDERNFYLTDDELETVNANIETAKTAKRSIKKDVFSA